MSQEYDKVPEAALEEMAAGSKAVGSEAKRMAMELIELRAQLHDHGGNLPEKIVCWINLRVSGFGGGAHTVGSISVGSAKPAPVHSDWEWVPVWLP